MKLGIGLGLLVVAIAAALLLRPHHTTTPRREAAATPPPGAWEQWVHLEGVVDVGGPRSDGRLVVMAGAGLFLVAPDGAATPFARGVGGYAGGGDGEAYFVVAPAAALQAPDCRFQPDDVFVLDFQAPLGIVRVDSSGKASRFATVPGADFLAGIAFDTVGSFGHRILVAAQKDGDTSVVAIDCRGATAVVAAKAPLLEGGIEVAPASFGQFGGQLIGPDEQSGKIWAIAPGGRSTLVYTSDLPSGGDTGVESAGDLPAGFTAGGHIYVADRGTADNPFPGTDSVLRLSGDTVLAAGVRPGDLLVATEGGGRVFALHCEQTCMAIRLPDGPQVAHIEGHIVAAP